MTYVQQFLKECCDVMPDQWALSKDLRDEYAAWAPDHAAPEVIGDEVLDPGARRSRRHILAPSQGPRLGIRLRPAEDGSGEGVTP